jgi:hypothetical protein
MAAASDAIVVAGRRLLQPVDVQWSLGALEFGRRVFIEWQAVDLQNVLRWRCNVVWVACQWWTLPILAPHFFPKEKCT